MYSKILAIFALASMATALVPRNDKEPATWGEYGAQACGNGQTISCCNEEDGDAGLDLDLDLNVLAAKCAPFNGLLLNLPLGQKACEGNVACCEKGDQIGVINLNVECNKIL
ncbi:hypothetical protein DM02DRAFT_614053 [Periconia macrospinosa]|uniref:Hydrophobin n=1 Tax=Periconia macrospinosa TaxID=97972 RepID=A0A2V1DUF1_9PLEO|nr:hypothetical protein DM02DRAFT_614053 [Periconia macrospinosa]